MSKTTVSVVVPYHGEPEIIDALDSVKSQTHPPDELIIVDDCSGSPPEEIADKYGARLIVHDENHGLAAARNTGIEATSSLYYLALDSDDWLVHNCIERMIRTSNHIPDCYLYPDAFIVNPHGASRWKSCRFDIHKLLRYNYIIATSFVPRMAWEIAGGYDIKYSKAGGWEDWNFWLTLYEHAICGFHVGEFLFNRRIRRNSMSRKIKGQRMKRLKRMLREDHLGLYEGRV